MKTLKGAVRYELVAEVQYDQKALNSVTRSDVHIYRPNLSDQFEAITYLHKTTVGGFFGFQKTHMATEYQLQTSSFVPGQFTTITVQHQNSQSKHTIDSFRFKLFRRITYNMPGNKQETAEYITQEKTTGCNKFQDVRRSANIFIPLVEKDGQTPLLGSCASDNFTV